MNWRSFLSPKLGVVDAALHKLIQYWSRYVLDENIALIKPDKRLCFYRRIVYLLYGKTKSFDSLKKLKLWFDFLIPFFELCQVVETMKSFESELSRFLSQRLGKENLLRLFKESFEYCSIKFYAYPENYHFV